MQRACTRSGRWVDASRGPGRWGLGRRRGAGRLSSRAGRLERSERRSSFADLRRSLIRKGDDMARTRLVASLLIVNGLLAMTALGWLVWITTSPRHWFADAYAAQGPRGEKGPRGEQGPLGPAGPVGPDAEDAIASLESDLSDVPTAWRC